MANNSCVFKFADVEVHEREFRLLKAGEVLPVEPKAFRVLLFLLRNPQKLMTKEELLNAVWSDAAVSENSLTRAIALLRRVLGDDPHEPRYIATVTSVGYRFVRPVEVFEEVDGNLVAPVKATDVIGNVLTGPPANGQQTELAVAPPPQTSENPGGGTKSGNSKDQSRQGVRKWLLFAAAILAICLAAAYWYLNRPLPVPRIAEYKPITRDGRGKWLTGTDGGRLYFNLAPTYDPAQIGVAGGESTRIPIAMKAPVIQDVSPDGSTFLIENWDDNNLWSAGVLGEPLRHLTTVDTRAAAWSPDGKTIVYTTPDGAISLMRSDGTEAHRLASAGGIADDIDWSPDGSTFRFFRDDALWEMSSSGSNLHRLLPEWPTGHCCGRWTPDGRFFVFLSGIRHITGTTAFLGSQIWIIDERRGPIRRPSPQPQQLTSGPMGWCCITPSKDGKTIFATGQTARGELVRFDARSRQLQPYMGGISAEFLSYSRDGKSVAYATYPDGKLWRADSDGSERVQLSGPPAYPGGISWSPDRAQLAFSDTPPFKDNYVMYLMPAQGGNPTRIIPADDGPQGDATWSPDGSRIAFWAGQPNDIRIVDLASHQITALPGSAGLFSPRWSPDGRSIIAMTVDSSTLKILDLATQRWSILLRHGGMGFPSWSHDGRYVYILYLSGDKAGVYRIRVTGGKAEKIVDLTGFHHTGTVNFWFGLDPTDAPLLLRDNGSDDIYALKLEEK
jgi:Tol biopolymer transport system component/DNA-binding winged helix-turn-helix (wHTH) protein